jgi:hypothetical protein
MSVPTDLREKYAGRINELVREGEAIKSDATVVLGRISKNFATGQVRRAPDSYRVDTTHFVKWKTNCISLLDAIVPQNHLHRNTIQTFQKHVTGYNNLGWAIGVLHGIGEDFDRNLLATSVAEIEYEISCDYLDEAKALLGSQGVSDSNITTAAVLTGIALERRLRRLWVENKPSGPTEADKTKPLGVLIDELKKTNTINETKAKQLRAWAGIRNQAAHGEDAQFSPNDLKHMIDGVRDFLDEQK